MRPVAITLVVVLWNVSAAIGLVRSCCVKLWTYPPPPSSFRPTRVDVPL